MFYATLCPEFERQGFVIVRDFLPGEALARLSAELERYIQDVVPRLPAKSVFYDDRDRPETLRQLHHMAVDPFFQEYRQDSRWRELAEDLLGERVTADEPEWFNKPPCSSSGTPPHQDNFYFCLNPCQVVTVWLALDRIDEENACLRYVPGSHRGPVRPHGRSAILGFSQGITDFGDADRAQEVPIVLNPGDAVAHHGNLIHRAEPNRSVDRHRRAFAMVVRGASCQRDEAAFARYHAALQQQQQELGVGA